MAVQPFSIAIGDAVVDDLRRRLRATRWIDELGDSGWSHGLSLPYLRELVRYWTDEFDWREHERALNELPQFRATLRDGRAIHFIHLRGVGTDPLPIILTHGFPDSVLRFIKLAPMLAHPEAMGADPNEAFDVVIPSLPGYGFSDPGGDGMLFRVAEQWHELMAHELGYEHYVAHGGDWGSTITEFLSRDHSDAVLGAHLTDVPFFHALVPPDDPTAGERAYLEQIASFGRTEGAYALIQGAQPQALALGLNDSPAGLAAWIVEKFRRWSDCDGDVERSFTRDELLANVTLYWVTQTIATSFQPYYDVSQANAMTWIGQKVKEWRGSSDVPMGFALFPKDLSHPPREWAERFYNVQRWTAMPRGGHFAALEEPELLAADIRAFCRPLRQIVAAMRSEIFRF